MTNNKTKPFLFGVFASATLLGAYLAILSLVSGWGFAKSQFVEYWYFVVGLVIGFGIQIALYKYIQSLMHGGQGMGKVVGVSGTTSTVAMISCCAHYLVNLVPILGVTGLVTFVAEFQTELFFVSLVFNVFGIAFISNKIIKLKKQL